MHRFPRLAGVLVLAAPLPLAQEVVPARRADAPRPRRPVECGLLTPTEVLRSLRGSPALRVASPAAPGPEGVSPAPPDITCITPAQLLVYEDTQGLLVGNTTQAELFGVMTDAANALIAAHGDVFDYVGYFTNFTPGLSFGAAFYLPIHNDIQGIGDQSGQGMPLFDARPGLGLQSARVDGYVMMHHLEDWEGGSGTNAEVTRLVLGHEFLHRFACFLPPFQDGRSLQGSAGCASTGHWSYRVDGQFDTLILPEFVGSGPALAIVGFLARNLDHPLGFWSAPALYLMGFVSGAEMDALASELRYMDTYDCSTGSGVPYNGPISSFTSADIVASAGPRVPDASVSQKHWKAGWIVLHQPGAPPTAAELDRVASILDQQQLDWRASSIGRGTLDNALFPDCDCDGQPDACGEAPARFCAAKMSSDGCTPFTETSGTPSATSGAPFTLEGRDLLPGASGLLVYGFGRANLDFHGGKLCVRSPFVRVLPTQPASGGGATGCRGVLTRNFNQRIQSGVDPLLTAGARVTAQYVQQDVAHPGPFPDTLTNGVAFTVQP